MGLSRRGGVGGAEWAGLSGRGGVGGSEWAGLSRWVCVVKSCNLFLRTAGLDPDFL